jgi:hypothetical protein
MLLYRSYLISVGRRPTIIIDFFINFHQPGGRGKLELYVGQERPTIIIDFFINFRQPGGRGKLEIFLSAWFDCRNIKVYNFNRLLP